MELRFAFLANAAETGADGRFFALGGGFDTIVAAPPVVMYALAVVAEIVFTAEELGRQHMVRVVINKPDGMEANLGANTGAIVIPMRPPFNEPIPTSVNICLNIYNLSLDQIGEYRMSFLSGDRSIGTHRFWVATMRAPEPTGE
jgi:hypothetical protein